MKGTLTKRGTKFWYYIYYPPRPPGSPGKVRQKKVSLKTKDKREAELLARKIWDRDMDIALGISRPEAKPRMYLRDLLAEYLRYLDGRRDMAPGSKRLMRDTCSVLIDICADADLQGITAHYIKTTVRPEMEARWDSPYTVRNNLGNFRTILGFAFEAGHINANPFTGHRGLMPKIPHRQPVSYTEEQIQELVAYLKDPRRKPWQRVFFLLVLNTGMRLSEAVWLRHDNCRFEMDKPYIHLREKTKGGKERFVAANRVVIEEIASLPRNGDQVFWMISNSTTAQSAYKDMRKKLPWLKRFHDLRSNRASWLIWNGQNLQEVMDQMGWGDKATLDMYRAIKANFASATPKETIWE